MSNDKNNNANKETGANVIAIVSGKGGSGKTMLAAMLAKIFDNENERVLLVDADLGTGGLTYYMGLNSVKNISIGITNLFDSDEHDSDVVTKNLIQKIDRFNDTYFIGVGDHRRYANNERYSQNGLKSILNKIIERAKKSFNKIIIDCRGGIDHESLAACYCADDIIIVAESDTTSYQATQHLVETLYDNNISHKVIGFYLNKVIDDPSVISRNGTASFKSSFLSAIPFDIDATRSFLVGEIPSVDSYFGNQVKWGISNKYKISKSNLKTKLRFSDFNGLSLKDRDTAIGGVLLSFIGVFALIMLMITKISGYDTRQTDETIFLIAAALVVMMSGFDSFRRLFGMLVNSYIRIVLKLISK